MMIQTDVKISNTPGIFQQKENFAAPSFNNYFQNPSDSKIRRIFNSVDLTNEFVKFLKTIFFQLDEKKVLTLMAEILEDPSKTDEDIYRELLNKIHTAKKRFPFLSQLKALFVLKKGTGKQSAEILKNFKKDKFHDYMEIYFRRDANTLKKMSKLVLDGKILAVCDNSSITLKDKIQAGAILSPFPYNQHLSLNDPDCSSPALEPNKTYAPISDEVPNDSVDLISCLGGLHHAPADRVEPFVQSIHKKLRPGGILLLREHDIADKEEIHKSDVEALASAVHTFVNAADGVSWEAENAEIRNFKSLKEWKKLFKNHGFTCITPNKKVLRGDPTENGMIAFIKNPTSLDELKEAISYRNDCTRPKDGTRATWIEWGNVRFAKQYAEYIQNHHSYAFDHIGHLRQHWKHFYFYIKESLKDPQVSLKDLFFSNNLSMNLFILLTATVQCGVNHLFSLPDQLYARWKHGENWRNVCNLNDLEKFEASYQKDYSSFLDHTPFYMYNYLGKMKEMWRVINKSEEPLHVRISNFFKGVFASLGFLTNAAISAPIRSLYTAEGNIEPDTVKVLVHDPNDSIHSVINRWEMEKEQEFQEKQKIEVIYETPDRYKLLSVPRYRPFTKICRYFKETEHLEILEIGNQNEISVDVLLKKDEAPPELEGAKLIYEMERLQDPKQKRYATYQVDIKCLKQFLLHFKEKNIEYIHE